MVKMYFHLIIFLFLSLVHLKFILAKIRNNPGNDPDYCGFLLK